MQVGKISSLADTLWALPSGNHGLSREVIAQSQRNRLLHAMVEAVAEHGYQAASVARVLERAGVSRRTFYELFKDKEDCFLAAYDMAQEALIQHIIEASEAAPGGWRRQFEAAFKAYLEFLAAEPDLSRLFLVEVLAAGPRLGAHRALVHARFAQMIRILYERGREQQDGLPDLPDVVFEGLTGGLNELVAAQVRRDAADRLGELHPALMYLTLATLVGPRAAAPYRRKLQAAEADDDRQAGKAVHRLSTLRIRQSGA